ncbi:MAG: flippase-like domain-containing protein [Sphingobacteriales bacterium]|nr:MAG: flippase-like domain-containing protein [Sphingobacteriales bacterium]
MTKKHIYTFLQIIIFMGLGLGLIYWRYTEMSPENKDAMMEAFKNINWWMLLPIFIVGFLSHYFRALRWKILLKTVSIEPSTTNTTFAVLIGYLVNTVVPRLGEVAKCTVLAKYEKTAPDKAIGTIIGERAFDMISLLIVMLLVFLFERHIAFTLFNDYFGKYFHDGTTFMLKPVLLAVTVLILCMIGFIFLVKKLKNTKVGNIIKSLGDGIASVWRMKARGAFLGYTFLIWLMYTLMVYIGYFSLEPTTGLGMASALAIIAFGSIGMIVTPGGIGTYPLIVAGVLLLFGINEGVGMAFGWICWGVQTVLVLILGLASLILLPIVNGKRNTQQAG